MTEGETPAAERQGEPRRREGGRRAWGGRGVGAGSARALAESGADAVICEKDEPEGRALGQELPGTVFPLCDVPQKEDVKTFTCETVRRPGPLDCTVNSAGYRPPPPPPPGPEEPSAQGCRQLLERSLRKIRGNVVNISSLVGAVGQSQAVPYVAPKGAVTAMTKASALDRSPYGVRGNCVSPGSIGTPLWEELAACTPDPAATVRGAAPAQPLGRRGHQLRWGLPPCSWPLKPTAAPGLSCW